MENNIKSKEQEEHWQRFNDMLKHVASLSLEQVKEIQKTVPEPKDLPKEDLEKLNDE
jgi:hypothetical protein